ncbi:pyruvate, phosphate dikinase [Conexibacter sp. SYSU D00693]|uniref:pyruvate, phosphate dikinase n=1 Tax=Conexibacter sp. SYSU D00693 TaxID=2812560 RepID=UPI00196BAC95|nr:pyruvate, phosphate dikinase [Conexibacter sp. SYSU D00693]
MLVRLDGTVGLGRELLGGKAWGLNRMRALGLPVPPAFCLPTTACSAFHAAGGVLPDGAREALHEGVAWLEGELGRTFAGGAVPMLLSVRSGAARSMPGMMDTVLNLGLAPAVQERVAQATGDAAFAADSRRRFVEQFTKVVGHAPPDDPWQQLADAAAAVFASWHSERAQTYRRHHGLPDDGGTAVTVQAMVFGNLDDRSGTGVLFSRNPLTGAPEPFGEYLPRGQGEDVVSGRHDPLPLSELGAREPALLEELLAAARRLEQDGRDVQDVEFTVEAGRLWLLQTRAAKRSPEATVRLAVALAQEGLLTPAEALGRVGKADVDALLRPHVPAEARAGAELLASGEPACPGVASGLVAVDAEEAEDLADEREVVLVRPTTDPDDVHGMIAATAIVTELGGSTSHAAVVSRELGRPCVVGCGAGTVDRLRGKVVTVDGGRGEVYAGELPTVATSVDEDPDLRTLRAWADEHPDVATPLRSATPDAAPAPAPAEQDATAQGPGAPLLALLDRLRAAEDVRGLFAQGADLARQVLGFDRALVLTVGPTRLTAEDSGALADPASDRLRRQVLARPVALQARTVEAAALGRGGTGAWTASTLAEELELRAFALGAVSPSGTPLAVLVVDRDGPEVTDAEHASVVDLAGVLGVALEQVLLRRRVREVTSELRHLTASAQALFSELEHAALELPSGPGLRPLFAWDGQPDAPATETPLSDRERDILRGMVAGRSNREIAEELVLSPETVKGHVARILRKLGAANRVEAVSRYLAMAGAGRP